MSLKSVTLIVLLFALSGAHPVAGDAPASQRGSNQRKGRDQHAATPTPNPTQAQRLRQAREDVVRVADAVDDMAADIEEFGTVSLSAPLLTLPTRDLWFNLRNSADTYYSNARTEVAGRAFAATAIAQSLGIDVQASADVDQLALARALRSAQAPQAAKIAQLEDLKTERAKLAYQAKIAEIKEGDSEAVKLGKKQEALAEMQKILDEPLNTKPAEGPKTGADSTPTVASAAPQVTSKTTLSPGQTVEVTDGTKKTTTTLAPGATTEVTTAAAASTTAPRVEADVLAAAYIAGSHTALGTAGKDFLGVRSSCRTWMP